MAKKKAIRGKKRATTMVMTVEEITPEVAEEMLRCNVVNRAFRLTTAKYYGFTMKRGEWAVGTSEGISFDAEGNLLNGQHRLHAIILAGIPIVLTVFREVTLIKDDGAKRNNKDKFEAAGHLHASALVSSLKKLYQYEEGLMPGQCSGSMSFEHMCEYIEKHPDLERSVEATFQYALKQSIAPKGMLAFVHYIGSKKNRASADEFLAKLCTGYELHEGCPVVALRKVLMHYSEKQSAADMKAAHKLAVIVKAWNAFVEGKRVPAVAWETAQFPEVIGLKRKQIKSFRRNYPHKNRDKRRREKKSEGNDDLQAVIF